MATRNDKSEWTAITLRVRAIRELEIATARELAQHIGCPEQRISEWINGHKEPRAEKTLAIQSWVKLKEAAMKSETLKAYKKILTRLANEKD